MKNWRYNKRRIILAAAATILLCTPLCAQVAISNESRINSQEITSITEQQRNGLTAQDVINYVETRVKNMNSMPEITKELFLRKLHSPTTEVLINKKIEQLEKSNDIARWEKFFKEPETEKIMLDSCEDLFVVFQALLKATAVDPGTGFTISGLFGIAYSNLGGEYTGVGINGRCELICSGWLSITWIIGGTIPHVPPVFITNLNIVGFGVYVFAEGY